MLKRICITFCLLSLISCASKPLARSSIDGAPAGNANLARLYIHAGKSSMGVRNWSDNQVGPVYINDIKVTSTAKDEHFIVDIKPGVYQLHCDTNKPGIKRLLKKNSYSFAAGEEHSLSCMVQAKAAAYFGLIGIAVAKHAEQSSVVEQSFDIEQSRLIGYADFRMLEGNPGFN